MTLPSYFTWRSIAAFTHVIFLFFHVTRSIFSITIIRPVPILIDKDTRNFLSDIERNSSDSFGRLQCRLSILFAYYVIITC